MRYPAARHRRGVFILVLRERAKAKHAAEDMASHVVVIDTSFRRTTIKVNPGTYVSDILDEACKKFSINPSNYGLKSVFPSTARLAIFMLMQY